MNRRWWPRAGSIASSAGSPRSPGGASVRCSARRLPSSPPAVPDEVPARRDGEEDLVLVAEEGAAQLQVVLHVGRERVLAIVHAGIELPRRTVGRAFAGR